MNSRNSYGIWVIKRFSIQNVPPVPSLGVPALEAWERTYTVR